MTAPGAGGHGIVGMRERALLLGGSFTAGAVGATYRLTARLPHRDAAGLAALDAFLDRRLTLELLTFEPAVDLQPDTMRTR